MTEEQRIYTTTEAAIKIGMPPRTLRWHVNQGHLAATILPGGDHAIEERELIRFQNAPRKPPGRPKR
jgi:hypothetical protein